MLESTIDILLGVFYAVILFVCILYYVNRKYKDNVSTRRLILWGAALKIFAIFAYAAVYKLYYGYGDTLSYHWRSVMWGELILEQPRYLWDVFMTSGADIFAKFKEFLLAQHDYIDAYNGPNYLVMKFSTFFGFFSFFQYLPTSVFFTAISLLGSIKVAQAWAEIFPKFEKWIYLAFLLIPSVVFWATGINKDSLSVGFNCFLIFALIRIFINKKFHLKYIFLAAISFYFAAGIKSYIPLILVPTFFIYVLSFYWNTGRFAKMRILKFFVSIAIIIVAVPLIYFIGSIIIADILQQQLEDMIRINVGQGTNVVEGDSSFDIGIKVTDLDNPIRILGLIPKSISVTLFRPWIWEVKNPLMLISAFESFFFFGFSLLVLFKSRSIYFIPKLLKHRHLLFFLLFTLLLAIPIGITGNFGTIVRYKIPLLPYFLIFLVMMNALFKRKAFNEIDKNQ